MERKKTFDNEINSNFKNSKPLLILKSKLDSLNEKDLLQKLIISQQKISEWKITIDNNDEESNLCINLKEDSIQKLSD